MRWHRCPGDLVGDAGFGFFESVFLELVGQFLIGEVRTHPPTAEPPNAAKAEKMLHFPARLSTSVSSDHDLSLAAFITNIAESDFRYTHA